MFGFLIHCHPLSCPLLCSIDTVMAVYLTFLCFQDLPEAVSAEELARYLDLKKLDERVYMFEAVSAYDG